MNIFNTLHPSLFSTTPEMVPIRKGFGEGLLLAGKADERVVGLCADLTESTYMHLFREAYPERFIEIGVAEQNLATVASGMAAIGKIPFITSYAMFSPGRNWEQIRTTICYNDRPVKIAGSHAGISVGPDGGTHQAIEDIALMRIIPNLVVISPCDALEARKATIAAAQTPHPTYIRLARDKTPLITTDDTPFDIGKGYIVYETAAVSEKKHDVVIVGTGSLVYQALIAAKTLEKEGKGICVVNIPTIKPLDVQLILDVAHTYDAIVTVEEHQIAGGLGGAVAEVVTSHKPVPIERVGVHDQFGQSGTTKELYEHYKMDAAGIIHAVHKVLNRKK